MLGAVSELSSRLDSQCRARIQPTTGFGQRLGSLASRPAQSVHSQPPSHGQRCCTRRRMRWRNTRRARCRRRSRRWLSRLKISGKPDCSAGHATSSCCASSSRCALSARTSVNSTASGCAASVGAPLFVASATWLGASSDTACSRERRDENLGGAGRSSIASLADSFSRTEATRPSKDGASKDGASKDGVSKDGVSKDGVCVTGFSATGFSVTCSSAAAPRLRLSSQLDGGASAVLSRLSKRVGEVVEAVRRVAGRASGSGVPGSGASRNSSSRTGEAAGGAFCEAASGLLLMAV